MGSSNDQPRRVRTTDTTFEIIDIMHGNNTISVKEISDRLDLALSTVYEHLATLEQNRYVVKEDGGYRLGLQFLSNGMEARNNYEVVNVAKPILDQLSRESEEAVLLVVEEHGKGIVLDRSIGDRAVESIGEVGNIYDLHYIAAGKAILAYLPESKVQEIIQRHGLSNKTSETITKQKKLFEELDQIRDQGYAIENNEAVQGLTAIAAPILYDEEPIGALDLSGPSNRIHGHRLQDELANMVMGASNEIELRLSGDNT